MAKRIFRKVALERLSSPEQLDQLITITTPIGWMSLFAIGGLLISAILWGIFGSVQTKVQGQGIVLKQGGIMAIQAQHPGTITEILIERDDLINQGTVIARLRQDQILEQIQEAQRELTNLEIAFQEKNKSQLETMQLQLTKLQQDQLNLQQDIKNLERQVQTQYALRQQKQEYLAGVRNLVEQGILSKNKALEAQNEIVGIEQQINSLQAEVEKAKNRLNSIQLEIKQLNDSKVLDALDQQQRIETLEINIQRLQKDFEEHSQVTSPYSGRVLEISVTPGTLVRSGMPIALIERQSQSYDLEIIAYFSPLVGKQIQQGMEAQITPSIIKREEYGFMEGIVQQVDTFPSTFNAVLKDVQNETLARMLTQDAAPIKVVISLLPDPGTLSGYKWSSRQGPPIEIQSGTICTTEVTVKSQPPITLVIPLFKKYLFGSMEPEDQP